MKTLALLLFSLSHSVFADPVPCEERNNSMTPIQWDILTLKEDASYTAQREQTGLNFETRMSRKRIEYDCHFAVPRENTKCYYEISLAGTSKDGAPLFIPAGATANVSRIIQHQNQIVIWPNRTPGLIRSHSGNFQISCEEYHLNTRPNGNTVVSNSTKIQCNNRLISLLFENNSLNDCRNTGIDTTTPVQGSDTREGEPFQAILPQNLPQTDGSISNSIND